MRKILYSRFVVAILTCILSLTFIFPALAETVGYGPGYPGSQIKRVETIEKEVPAEGRRGESLGMFSTTGYCNCNKCSGEYTLTYSGTVPTANHTISADLTNFPIGTKLMINDVIYTVEDKGSAVHGNVLDIYFNSHEEALAHGRRAAEVFAVIEDTDAADTTESLN